MSPIMTELKKIPGQAVGVSFSLLMMVLGAHFSGLLWARVAYAVIFIFILVRVVNKMPLSVFEKYFFRPA